MCTACCTPHVFTDVCIPWSGIETEPQLDLTSDTIFHLGVTYLCFSYLFLLTVDVSRYNCIFFLRTPGFHLMLVRQLFLAVIFIISFPKMIIYSFPSYLHIVKSGSFSVTALIVSVQCTH